MSGHYPPGCTQADIDRAMTDEDGEAAAHQEETALEEAFEAGVRRGIRYEREEAAKKVADETLRPTNSRQAAVVVDAAIGHLEAAYECILRLTSAPGLAARVHTEFYPKLGDIIRSMKSALGDLEHEADEEEFGPDEEPYTQADFVGDARHG